MANFNPPPLFPPSTNPETNMVDPGSVVINHGKIPRLVVDPEIIPHLHIQVDPNPESNTADTTSPPLAGSEPENQVRPHLSLVDIRLFFIQHCRTLNRIM